MRFPGCRTASTWSKKSTASSKTAFATHDNRAVAAYLDVDRFKDINDTLGHDAGDELIKLVAQRLMECLRPNDFLARFGGDEFVIYVRQLERRQALRSRNGLIRPLRLRFAINGQNIRVTASVGIAVAPDNGVTADELMRHADIALYEAKDARSRPRGPVLRRNGSAG